MAEDGQAVASGGPAAPPAPSAGHGGHGPADNFATNAHHAQPAHGNVANGPLMEEIASLTSPRLFTPNPFSRKNTSLDIDDYFVRPLNTIQSN